MRAVLAAAIVLFGLILSLSHAHAREGQSNTPQNSRPENGKPEAKTQGQFLVASRGLGDPLFEQSVVLMLPIKEGALLVGLIVNKPSKIKVRELFPDSPGIEANDSMVYFGGPVDAGVGARSAIFRSKTPRDKATQVFGDVYVTFDPGVILAVAENSQQAANVRVFVGRAQWDPDQFEGEVSAGAWHSLRGGADSIFTALPEMLWPALIERTEPKPVVREAPGLAAPGGLSTQLAYRPHEREVLGGEYVR